MQNSIDNFDIDINEEEFLHWYKNWRTESMPVIPNDTAFEIWMDFNVDTEFEDITTLLGKTLWYAVDQETRSNLETDVFYSGVIVKNGKVTKEDETSFFIEGYDKPISKNVLSHYVFLNRSTLLYSLHYDGEVIYSGRKIIPRFLNGEFVIEE